MFSHGSYFQAHMIAEVTGGPRESEPPESISGEGSVRLADVPIGEVGGWETWLWKPALGDPRTSPVIKEHWGVGDIEVGWLSWISKGQICEVL